MDILNIVEKIIGILVDKPRLMKIRVLIKINEATDFKRFTFEGMEKKLTSLGLKNPYQKFELKFRV